LVFISTSVFAALLLYFAYYFRFLEMGLVPGLFGRFDLAALHSHTFNFCLFVCPGVEEVANAHASSQWQVVAVY
jgi:hypothetical protein